MNTKADRKFSGYTIVGRPMEEPCPAIAQKTLARLREQYGDAVYVGHVQERVRPRPEWTQYKFFVPIASIKGIQWNADTVRYDEVEKPVENTWGRLSFSVLDMS
ncbi:hypothetical protein A2382_04245 [Candidatus Woesebacteria bacterium RIFOXYB1_FULL_38_16]|uniref:Uncharacterized protein n=1 Tax=Candidatus Woesebacteria bacterium RIFOXYB1_FULL_38_16 TaxID=1802538 RepID=A0A1F8CU18_9BACT|nr:MAG: hypothetical protein A2382_04245 [Candidatus Woesebacteria bacterium RIFOXYB1_FULL_38_16]